MPNFSHTIVFKAVRGAVKNTIDGHPNWVVPRDFARSVAKRAAGTLAGFAPEVALAAARRSGQRMRDPVTRKAFATKIGQPPERFKRQALRAALAELNAMAQAAHKARDDGAFLVACTAARHLKQAIKISEAAHD
jgi:hypothetical protein